jgi:hypothetical protein
MRLAILLALLLMVLAVVMASAHGAPSGWVYDSKCCSTGDCAFVEPKHVTVSPEGFVVELQPGDHPYVKVHIRQVIPYTSERLRQSGDDHYHVCVNIGAQEIRCLYKPDLQG